MLIKQIDHICIHHYKGSKKPTKKPFYSPSRLFFKGKKMIFLVQLMQWQGLSSCISSVIVSPGVKHGTWHRCAPSSEAGALYADRELIMKWKRQWHSMALSLFLTDLFSPRSINSIASVAPDSDFIQKSALIGRLRAASIMHKYVSWSFLCKYLVI